MEKAKRARKAETPKQTSLRLRLRAPHLYPDRPSTRAQIVLLAAAGRSTDILDVDVAQLPGQQGAGPAGEPGRRRFIEPLGTSPC